MDVLPYQLSWELPVWPTARGGPLRMGQPNTNGL
jgi:hypothetical protein